MKTTTTTTAGLLVALTTLRLEGSCRLGVGAFTVHPASFNSYPVSSDKAPDDAMRAESERIQTRLREQQGQLTAMTTTTTDPSATTTAASGTNVHHDVDKSKFERILVQLAAEYVQDTTELCKTKSSESTREEVTTTIIPTQAWSSDSPPSLINERLPAFLKPIPSNSTTTPTTTTTPSTGAMAATATNGATDDEQADGSESARRTTLGKRARVSRFLSTLNPFRRRRGGEEEGATPAESTDDTVVVDIDDCPSWA